MGDLCYCFFAEESVFVSVLVSTFAASTFGVGAGDGGAGLGVSTRDAGGVGDGFGGSALGADSDFTSRGAAIFGCSTGAMRGPLLGRTSSGCFTTRGDG